MYGGTVDVNRLPESCFRHLWNQDLPNPGDPARLPQRAKWPIQLRQFTFAWGGVLQPQHHVNTWIHKASELSGSGIGIDE
jgi:hypothetical protein